MSPRRRWAALGVLSASLLVIVMDLTILNVALPELTADLRPSATAQLWIVDIYSLLLAGLLITMSSLGDRWGRKRMLLTGFVVFGGASLLVLLADTPATVIAVRALLGVGGAMIMPTTLSLIRSIFTDPAERARALGVWAATSGLGAAIGPIVGGFLLEHFSWQAAFLVNVPFMALALGFGLWLLPEARDPKPGRWDFLGTVGSIAGMVALVWAIKHFAKEGLDDVTAWAALALALTLLTWFVRRCLTREDPLLDVRLFRRAPLTAGTIAALASMFAMAAMLLLVAQWLQNVEGFSPLAAGVRLLPLAVGGAIASALAPWLATKVGERAVLAGGLAIAAAGLGVVGIAGEPLAYGAVAVALALIGAGFGSLAIGSVLIMNSTPPEKAGNAAAIEEVAYDLGNVLGIAILGSIAAAITRAQLTDGAAPDAAFTESLVGVGLIGGVTMLAVSGLVYALLRQRVSLST